MTPTTSTPFVNTPFGVGVVEVSDLFAGDELFVRFEDGSRRWVHEDRCTFDVDRPDWYREPDPRDVPGYVR